MACIDAHRGEFGVEPICRAPQFQIASQRPGFARPRSGHLRTRPRRSQRRRGDPSQRPRRAISVHPLQRAPRRQRRRVLGGVPRRQLRQRAGRDHDRALQGRARPQSRSWRGLHDLELATLEWVDWFNHRRLYQHNPGRVPPAEAEDLHYRRQHSPQRAETQTKQPA